MNELCPNEYCKSTTCNIRQPRVCKFFTMFGSCKFGNNCSYKHTISKTHSDISELKVEITKLKESFQKVFESLAAKENEIGTLSERIKELETINISPKTIKHTINKFTCNHCGIAFKTEKSLKTHMIKTHEVVKLGCEVSPVKSKLLSEISVEERVEDSHDSPEISEMCAFCGEKFSDRNNLVVHNLENHIAVIPPQQCLIGECTNTAHNYFPSIKLSLNDTPPYEHIYMCDGCTRYVPLQELERSPPVKF